MRYNMKKTKVVIITYFVLVSLFISYKTINIEAQLSNNTVNYESNNGLDISTKDYYSQLIVSDDNYKEIIENSNDYLLYFHQDECEYCYESNVIIDEYITNKKGKIFFITPQSSIALFKDNNIESTPTLIEVKNNIQTQKIIGSDNIIEFIKNQ